MGSDHLESCARALEEVYRELYPEYEWRFEVREGEASEIPDTTDRPPRASQQGPFHICGMAP
jgi:hypothetical protein